MAEIRGNALVCRKDEFIKPNQWEAFHYGQRLKDYNKKIDDLLIPFLGLACDDDMRNDFVTVAKQLYEYKEKAKNHFETKKSEANLK